MNPRNRYIRYVDSLAETSDLDTLLSYEDWLETDETRSEYGSPYNEVTPKSTN